MCSNISKGPSPLLAVVDEWRNTRKRRTGCVDMMREIQNFWSAKTPCEMSGNLNVYPVGMMRVETKWENPWMVRLE